MRTVIQKKNETVERYKFNTRNQESGETIYNFVTELKLLSQYCAFEHLEESLVKDRIVCGTNDPKLRERLLRESDLNFQKCLDICRAWELSKERLKEIDKSAAAAEVNVFEKCVKTQKRKSP